jgi:hypothetical protein
MNPATDDITKNRHRNSPTSNDAYKRIKGTKQEMWDAIVAFGIQVGGFTSKEFAEHVGKNLNEVSGRLSEAKAMDLIVETKERRNGCAVLRVVRFA